MKKIVFALMLLPLMTIAQNVALDNLQVQRVGSLSKEVNGTSTLFFLDGRLWTCNDHGQLRLYALDTLTAHIDSVVDLGVKVYDLEEVTQDDRYLYFGDFGDNNGVRNDLCILRLAKSDLRKKRYRFDTIAFSYPDRASGVLARNFDCEACTAIGDSLYLFTKQWISQGSTCYALPKTPGRHVAKRCFTFSTRGLVTGACYLHGSRCLVLLGYNITLQPFLCILEDFDGKSFGSARRLTLDISLGTQAEGIASRDGRNFFFTNEAFELAFVSRKAALQKIDLRGFMKKK
jgi:hypothetical protein